MEYLKKLKMFKKGLTVGPTLFKRFASQVNHVKKRFRHEKQKPCQTNEQIIKISCLFGYRTLRR